MLVTDGSEISPSQAFTGEDGRLWTVHSSMWTTDQNLGSDHPSNGQNQTLDQDYHFEVDEWTDFWRWTIKNIKMLTEVDGWTDGRKSVRRGLVQVKPSEENLQVFCETVLVIFQIYKMNYLCRIAGMIIDSPLLANHGKLIQNFFWNFHFPGRHTGRFTGKLSHSNFLTETINDM